MSCNYSVSALLAIFFLLSNDNGFAFSGEVDPLFYPGAGPNGQVYAIAKESDGRILVAGAFNADSFCGLARLNPNGSRLSSNFGIFHRGEPFYALAVQPDGKILAARGYETHIARITTNGNFDTDFNVGIGANGLITSIVLQTNGMVIIAGGFTNFNGTNRSRIARLNTNGSVDVSFNSGTGPNDSVSSMAIQADGKIFIGGSFTSVNGTNRNHIARLNTDGSLDSGFDPESGTDGYVKSMALQPDGKLLIVGYFGAVNGTNRNFIARLESGGSLDESFNPETGPNSFVNAVCLQADDKILVGGWFSSFNGTNRNFVARLNNDGGLDLTFNPIAGVGTAGSNIESMTVQSDEKVIVGGWQGVARLLLTEPPRFS